MMTRIKNPSEIHAMRLGGRMLAAVLDVVSKRVTPGITTKELSRIASTELRALGGESSFLGHQGFPDVICISINDEVVHGIPSPKRVLQSGDFVGIDFGVRYKGLITDAAVTVIVGTPLDPKHSTFLKIAERALYSGIGAVHGKVKTGDIGAAIEAIVKPYHYGIVRDLVGHGVGDSVWEDPNIPNYGRPNTGNVLETGMTIAIEPMLTLGSDQVVMAEDAWTIKTADASPAVHFEHTVLITEDGAEILTIL